MIRKIPIAELMVGMYVVDSGLSWLEHPFLFSQEGDVPSSQALQAIQDAGYLEAFVDTDKGRLAPTSMGPPPPLGADKLPAGYKGTTPLQQELPVAAIVHHDCLLIARDILRAIQSGGEIDVGACSDMVAGVVGSVTRNPDALLTLCKLRSHDAYTFTHGVNVSVLASAFGAYLGLRPAQLRELGLAGLFHDVGKTGIADGILNKPGPLSPTEFAAIRTHPSLGQHLLAGLQLSESVLRGVAEHHERFDGSGYPRGLAGAAIHPWGRMLSLADVYDALTSRRSYKGPMLANRALAVILGMRGQNFPVNLAERFIKFLGPYPVGSCVRLNTQEVGFVRSSNPTRPMRPVVLVVCDGERRRLPAPRLLDLSAPEAADNGIGEAVNPSDFGLDPSFYLTGKHT